MPLSSRHLKIQTVYSPEINLHLLYMSKQTRLPPKPVEPKMSECCQRGCENCVFVYYEKALARWEKKIEKITAESE